MTHTAKYISNLEQIREIASKDNDKFLSRLNKETDWHKVEQIIKTQINELSSGLIFDIEVLKVFKIVLLGEIYKLNDQALLQKIIEKSSFRNFVGIESELELPDVVTLRKFQILLRTYGVYNDLLDVVLDKVIPENESILETSMDFIPLSQNELIDKKIAEIEKRIEKLHERNLYPFAEETASETQTVNGIKDKLADVENQVKDITRLVEKVDRAELQGTSKTAGDELLLRKLDEQIYQKLQAIEKRLERLDSRTTIESEEKETASETTEIEERLSDITDSLKSLDIPPVPSIEETDKTMTKEEETPEPEITVQDKLSEEPMTKTRKAAEPFIITPKEKTAGIFNDANLTEDYELGYRFFELGFKTGFFNIKVDKNDEASRIATAEFFPNTFWAAVKQRSRWIAGICFQNWSAHKWKGNIVTKYFLFRDRKSLFTFVGAFLSNIVFLYFLYAVIARIFKFENAYSLVGHSSVLWYLMIANLVFMISRAAHRFAFTYNWYGFKYAFFSFFRLILDTFINFVAIIRSISVYRKTKKQVVWDATSHY